MAIETTFKIMFFAINTFNKKKKIQKFCKQLFQDKNISVGVNFYLKEIVLNRKLYALQIWNLDTETEKYRFLNPTYCKGVNGTLIVITLSEEFSTGAIIPWIEMIKNAKQNAPIIILVTKSRFFVNPSHIYEIFSHLDEKNKVDEIIIFKSQLRKMFNKSFILLINLMLKNINS